MLFIRTSQGKRKLRHQRREKEKRKRNTDCSAQIKSGSLIFPEKCAIPLKREEDGQGSEEHGRSKTWRGR